MKRAAVGHLILRFLVFMSLAVMVLIGYVEVIYLPQKYIDEQQGAIQPSQREISALRQKVAAENTKRDDGTQEALKQRIHMIEVLVRKTGIVAPPPPSSTEKEHSVASNRSESTVAPPNDAAGANTVPSSTAWSLAEGGREKVYHNGSSYNDNTERKPIPPRRVVGTNRAPPAAAQAPTDGVRNEEPTPAPPAPARPTDRGRKKVTWRADNRCGKNFPQVEGATLGCDPDGSFPCCAPSGWCGNSPEHCSCSGCVDFTPSSAEILDAQASAGTYNSNSSKAIALIVPMRDRGVHLERFRERIQSHVDAWIRKGVKHRWMVFVVEQFDNALFNRGYLFNVGFRLAMNNAKAVGRPFDCVVMHDIDILPEPVVDYGWCVWPNQIAGEIECWGWSVPYADNVGGVVSLSPRHWRITNGFSNAYEGWGGEDDDLYLRLKQTNLLKGGCHTFCTTKERSKLMVYRPPIGRGRFDCLHDADHTPRQRSSDDASMWARLNAMKRNWKRWRQDGISSIVVHRAGNMIETEACSESLCAAPEDPVPRRRLFGEIWARVSAKPILLPGRIRVTLERCPNATRPLQAIPAGVEHLRKLVAELFDGDACAAGSKFANANFVLVDITLGQSVMVGSGAGVVIPDSALPASVLPGETPAKPIREGSEQMVQGQRLSSWIRRLPADHECLIVVVEGNLTKMRQELVSLGRRWPMASPACIAQATMAKSKKYRVTPGTTWCGNDGWTHVAHFMVLRSSTSVPSEDAFPICIAYNEKHYTYRFDASEKGCIGEDPAMGAIWKHSHTIYTSRKAKGERLCVGVASEGPKTRWIMRKGDRCDVDGFIHKFGFSAMNADFKTPLARACITAIDLAGLGLVRRLVVGDACKREKDGDWTREKDLVLLAMHSEASSFHKICVAEGTHEVLRGNATSGAKVWRTFRDAACDKRRLVTLDGDPAFVRTSWEINTSNALYVPPDGSGALLCHCQMARDKATALPYYTWTEGDCVQPGSTKVLCFHTLTTTDIVRRTYLMDEVS
mmetsp:Transcript_53825/g.149688  ORF Transcript_53825/g.149688 Transcript_53825/m.149688 type:complete len:1018 (-) Transcript_53825:80-3133(-)